MVTSIQKKELCATSCEERRENLLSTFVDIAPEVVMSSSFAFDVPGAGWGEAEWNDGSGLFEKMLVRLECLDRMKGKHKKREKDQMTKNLTGDVVIAETAIKMKATLVSEDSNLRQVVTEFGGCAVSLEEMRSR